jgi:hypothetical protein
LRLLIATLADKRIMIHIRSFEPMPTRPCRYCLALQDDSVFADFDVDQNGCLYLVRISFDGYGCCHPDTKIKLGKIDNKKSERLIKQIEANDFEAPEASQILSEFLNENRGALWEDALKEHGLI